jgi:hypothetical protein
MFPDVGEMDEVPVLRKHALWYYRMYVRIPVYQVTECLHSANHYGNAAVAVDLQFKDIAEGIENRAVELAKRFSVVSEIHP